MYYRDSYHLERQDVKWVVLRGLTAGASHVLNVCAVCLHRIIRSGVAEACRGSYGLSRGPHEREHDHGGSFGPLSAR